jgi:tetraacyldisaccharide 4'-kinase
MMLIKPKFWDNKIGFFSIILFPLSLVFLMIIFIKKKVSKVYKFKIPIICVGNVYVGGTGKTPLSILVANEIKMLGKKPVILRKFYESHKDEYELIKNNLNNLIVNKKRIDGIIEAEESNYDIAILDDGLQDYKIKKDLNIVCFNEKQLIGNGLVMPAGPLRESLNILKSTDIVIINGNKNKSFEEKILNINDKLKILYSNYKPVNIEKFKKKKLFAFAGIGNPENFFQLMENNGLFIKKRFIYPDHYEFSKNEIMNIVNEAKEENSQIITTEKDYYKIRKFDIDKIQYIKIELNIEDRGVLIEKIKRLYD